MEKLLILVGDTQTAKSSFIRDISQNNLDIQIGYGDGFSVNKSSTLYCLKDNLLKIPNLNCLDKRGTCCTTMISDLQTFKEVEEILLQNKFQECKFIITECFQDSTLKIHSNVLNLLKFTGTYEFLKSTIILVTKSNQIDFQMVYDNKMVALKQELNKYNIQNIPIIDFQTTWYFKNQVMFEPSQQQKIKQITQLSQILKQIQPCNLTFLKNYQNLKNQKRAEFKLEYQQQVQVEIMVDEVQQKTVKQPIKKVRYEKRQKLRGGIAGMFNKKKTYIVEIPYTDYINVQQSIIVQVPKIIYKQIPYDDNFYELLVNEWFKNEHLNMIKNRINIQ